MMQRGNLYFCLLAAMLLEIGLTLGSSRILQTLWDLGLPTHIQGFALSGVYLSAVLLLTLVIVASFARFRPSFFSIAGFSSSVVDIPGFLGLLFPVALLGRVLDPQFDSLYSSAYNLSTFAHVGRFLVLLPFFLLAEELVIRFFQRSVTQLAGPALAVITTAFNFALLHYIPAFREHAVMLFLGIFFGALVLNALYQRTQQFWTVFLVHVLYDAVIILQIYFHVHGRVFAELLLWTLFGTLFFVTIKKTWPKWRGVFMGVPKQSGLVWLVAIAMGVVLPIILITV